MSEFEAVAKLRKWPFYLADIVLSGIAAWVIYRLGPIQGSAHVVIILGCVLAASWAAWLSVTPWLIEFRAQTQRVETTTLSSSLAQIKDIERVADLIRQANSQWQAVQDAAGRTVNAAQEISERMKLESGEFMKFIQTTQNDERAGLRLEVEKLRRMEGDWIKVLVQMLDHTYALTRAAERAGQQGVFAQLSQYQNACRDLARRMGIAPFVPLVGEAFDPRAHQLPDANVTPEENARIADVLATGFTYQGQLLRRSLVLLETVSPEPAPGGLQESAQPSDSTPAELPPEPFPTAQSDAGQSESRTPPPASEAPAIEPAAIPPSAEQAAEGEAPPSKPKRPNGDKQLSLLG